MRPIFLAIGGYLLALILDRIAGLKGDQISENRERKSEKVGFHWSRVMLVEAYVDRCRDDYAMASEINKSAQARLVWFVAIAGFALLNARGLAEAVSGTTLGGNQLLLLASPWAITAILGIAAHWTIGDFDFRNMRYQSCRLNRFQAFVALAREEPSDDEVNELLDEKHEDISKSRSAANKVEPIASWLERLTFVALAAAFVWSIVYPLLVSASAGG